MFIHRGICTHNNKRTPNVNYDPLVKLICAMNIVATSQNMVEVTTCASSSKIDVAIRDQKIARLCTGCFPCFHGQ